MNIIYRTLIIFERKKDEYHFIYGHSIEWDMSPIDYSVDSWESFNIDSFCIFYRDFKDKQFEEQLYSSKKQIVQRKGKEISFSLDYNDEQELFVGVSSHENTELTPFIHYSCHKKVLFKQNESVKDIHAYLQNKKASFKKIGESINIDLVKYPANINTFSFISPTRISIRFKGFKEENGTKGFYLNIWDEFSQYTDAKIFLELFFEGKIHLKDFQINENPERFAVGFVPDRTIITIIDDNGRTVYKQDAYLLKELVVDFNVAAKKIQLKDKKKTIQTYSKETMRLSKE